MACGFYNKLVSFYLQLDSIYQDMLASESPVFLAMDYLSNKHWFYYNVIDIFNCRLLMI